MSKTIANVDVMAAKMHGEPVASEGQEAQLEARHSVGSYGPDAWPINWNGIVLGMLAAIAGLMLCGLTGIALKAHAWGTNQVLSDFKTIGTWSLVCSIFGTFFSFAAAGWIAGQIAGFRKAEPCMLHGACAWLLTVPILAYLAASGAGAMFGGWLSGLSPNHPGWNARPTVSIVADPASADRSARVIATEAQIAAAARNTALGVAAALLMGLMGAVLGGWMSSGEPMTFTYYKTRGAPSPAY
jgi:hypothetical protein